MSVGAQIAGYRLEELVGRGGMGVVYAMPPESFVDRPLLTVPATEETFNGLLRSEQSCPEPHATCLPCRPFTVLGS